ncbi:MAG: 50S ribosomal protein L1 [Desulfurococcaceae archaeon]|nr:MAG: 50S ribosomal protein L1 [Desulfurococcaceae archaeon]
MLMLSKEILAQRIAEAIKIGSGRRFKQSVELVVVFKGIDPKSPKARFRDAVYLPKGLGKSSYICVVADGDTLIRARNAGVDLVISREELQKLSKKQAKAIASKCDWILVRTDLMGLAGRILGPALGPRGKAPTPLDVNADIASLVKYYRSVTRLRNKEQPFVSGIIGSEDMNPEDLAENALAVLGFIENKLEEPLTAAVKKIIVKTTMGIPVEVPVQ